MKYILAVIFVISLGVAVFGVIYLQKVNQPTENTPLRTESPKITLGSGNYIEYTKSGIEENTDKRRVLFFYANWCPTCRPADANFEANLDKIPEDVVIIRVNYADTDTDQEEKDLAKKYNIVYQHTFVQIDGEGNVVARWNGGQIEELLARIK